MDARWENATNGYLKIIYSMAFKWKIIFSPFQTRQYCLAGLMNNLTRGLVVLQRDHILGPLLQTLQEVDNLQIFLVELKYFSSALCILTRSRISSALGDWKVNSSLRTVTRVKVWENALLLLKWDACISPGTSVETIISWKYSNIPDSSRLYATFSSSPQPHTQAPVLMDLKLSDMTICPIWNWNQQYN